MTRLRSRALLGALTLVVAAVGAAVIPAGAAHAVAPADHTLYWNGVLLRIYRMGGAPGPLARAGAMMHAAMYDAANSAKCRVGTTANPVIDTCIGKKYLVNVTTVKNAGANAPVMNTAIDYAAVTVLRSLYPTVDFDADLATAQEGVGTTGNQKEAIYIGQTAGNAMNSARAADGSTNTPPYVEGTVPGAWRNTGSGSAATPNWGGVTPFSMTSGTQFRPQLPLGYANYASLLASSGYAAQVNEIKSFGSATSTTRTADQTQLAWFWANDLDGTYKPPGQLFAHTAILSQLRGLSTTSNVRLFALVAIAMADAGIASWDAKYRTAIDLWRPESAVRLADTDGNAATVADPTWKPLSANTSGVNFSPPFPAYISGHATFAAAWAGVMKAYLGTDAVTWTATTEDPHAVGVTRTFTSISAAATENALSRIYLGVHYRFDADYGLAAGDGVATHVVGHELTQWQQYGGVYPDSPACHGAGTALVQGGSYEEYKCVEYSNETAALYVR
ncbi:vanadium-dependent haloperoxidase [Catellatospora sichuanensis]|uniref:vanadium-dependent haloperoxidase n=1 Tax=Catellatospora sichuanensis TaxID=1969805 RepID=UPI001C911FF6|nr:vanadium-dependent haloperoxidase [Catellatospora sichuanensis]